MPAIHIQRWFSQLLDHLKANRQRQLVTIRGSRAWCDAQIDSLHQLDSEMQLISDRKLGNNPLSPSKAEGLLGGESHLVVLDLFTGFNPDVFCIAAGLVPAGGVLILLAPPLADWSVDQDGYAGWQDETRSEFPWFVEYFFAAMESEATIGIFIDESAEFIEIPEQVELNPVDILDGQTEEQTQSLQIAEAWLTRKKSGILLLSAARGRGKSTCLGQLANLLLQRGVDLRVTASSRRAASAVFAQASTAEFIAPDQLLQVPSSAELLLVDEAATIPQSVLRQLHRLYPRMIMATTQGGYEGTGQGFRLRFLTSLDSADLQEIELHNPVRWCPGDALERWIDRTLRLNPQVDGSKACDLNQVQIEVIENPGQGDQRERVLKVYELLNAAHYRTRPSDLRMLMENPELVVVVARSEAQILAAALLNPEGGFGPDLCEQVFLGKRRPRGHLLAQMLTAQAGSRRFAELRGMRIQRIAVSATHRRRGLGSRLIEFAAEYAREHEFGYLGASFALEPENAEFWRQTGFALAHVSYACGKSSGRHSIAVLKPLSEQCELVLDSLQRRLQQQLPIWLTQFLQYMESEQTVSLLRFARYQCETDEILQADVDAFCQGNKGFELCFASIQTWVMQRIAHSHDHPDPLLVEKAIQNHDWNRLERTSGTEGRKQLQQRLRSLVAGLEKAC